MLPEFNTSPALEIKAKVDFWHSRLTSQLYRFNGMADYWRLVKPNRDASLDGFANPQLTETTRAVEAIATFWYRALTSAQPNFQMITQNPAVTQYALYQSEQIIEWQKIALQYNRKLMKGLRSLALFGTLPFEQPWRINQRYQGTDFVPRSLLQFAFDPSAYDIDYSGWYAVIDFVTEDVLINLAKEQPDVWDGVAIQNAIDNFKDAGRMPPEVVARLAAAGYYSYTGPTISQASHVYQMVTYYGPLKDNPNPTGKDWCISTINDTEVIRAHDSSYRSKPYDMVSINEFEMEPYGYGVGRIAEAMQPELNSNRGRMHDCITFGLFNMWIASRMSNIKTTQLRVRPWGVVEVDGDAEGLKAIRPQLEAVNFGVKLEELMKNEFRATTGATDNLQAMVTEATATESSIAQNEAVRRLSVMAEIVSDKVCRRHFSKMHENNLDFLDQPFWLANTGEGKPPMRVFPSQLAQDAEVVMKVVTDKDFRPQRNKDILQFLQIVTSIRNDHPELGQIPVIPWIQELARGVGMNPNMVKGVPLPPPGMMPGMPGPGGPGGAPPTAMDKIGAMIKQAQSVRGNAGELGAQAHALATAPGAP